jgi:hypothetical protein
MSTTDQTFAGQEFPYGYIKDGKIFLKSFLHFPDRVIGEVKTTHDDAVIYFKNRFENFQKKANEVFELIENAENKGSYLQKILHLKNQCESFEALGDFTAIYVKLEDAENQLNDIISKNRIKNLAQKKAILEELNIIKESNDWLNASEKIKELKNNWIRIGAVEKIVEDEVENSFKEALDVFFTRRKEFYDARNELNTFKINKYAELADKAEALRKSVDFKIAFEEMKKLTAEWKAVGIISKKDLEPLMGRFRSSSDFIFKKFKEAKRNVGFNLSAKSFGLDRFKEIAEAAEKIALEMPRNGDNLLKQLQEEWKKTGYSKLPEYKELEFRFRSSYAKAMDTYFLLKICAKRHPEIFKLPSKEQVKIQIGILKELIQRDKEQIENFENSFSKQELNAQSNSFDNVFGAKLMVQKRGLVTKELILKELENKLKA